MAEQLQIVHHSAVGLVDRSVEQNLIAREILEQLSGTHRAEIRRLGPRLGLLLKSLMLDENH